MKKFLKLTIDKIYVNQSYKTENKNKTLKKTKTEFIMFSQPLMFFFLI